MHDTPTLLADLIACYAQHGRCTAATTALRATGSGDTYARLRAGRDITTRRAARVVQWLSDHWPPGAEWPADIARPAPARGSPAASLLSGSGSQTPCCQIDDPVAAAKAAYDRMIDADNPEDRRAAAAEAWALGSKIDKTTGHIADHAVLCAALGVSLQTYYDVVRRHRTDRREGRRHRKPPRRGAEARMFDALQRAGDARFTPSTPSTQKKAAV